MSLLLVGLSLALLLAGGLAALLLGRRDRAALAAGTAGAVAACVTGFAAGLGALLRGESAAARSTWPLPLGEIHLGIDPLSSFFLICVCLVSGLAAVYGAGYLLPLAGRRRLAPPAAFFNLLVAAMIVVVIARDAILFLIAWEIMAIASFFLVTFDHEREEVRRAGMTYLIASHAGGVFVFLLFASLARHAGGFDFDAFVAAADQPAATLLFLLALAGFGAKAGFWPLHVWLPDAHPAAPSHVSAVMSGVMIKMGVYGLLRTLTFLPEPPPLWGGLLILVGCVSALTGMLHALGQRELKRVLAYSSVENVGLIALALGLGLLGRSRGLAAMAALGFTAALLHVLNHGLLKGVLFQAAGGVLKGAGTGELDRLGGLYRRMPATGTLFLAGGIGLCGLPPMNGFVSEWLIALAAFRGGGDLEGAAALGSVLSIGVVALVGGLAAAGFVRAFGTAFLGTPRSDAGAGAHDPGRLMIGAGGAGVALCLLIGVWPQGPLQLLRPAVAALAGAGPDTGLAAGGPPVAITRVAAVLVVALGAILLARALLLRAREVRAAPTWGCGYDAPTARMQYTAASFAEPVLAPFAVLVHARVERQGPDGFLPKTARYDERHGDLAGERLLVPAGRALVRGLSRFRVLQQGRLQIYLAYILITLVLLLVWQLGGIDR